MATRINLLDWRAERRERRQRQFFALLGLAVAVAGLVVGSAYTYMKSQISYQQQRNEFLHQQIAEMDKKIQEIRNLQKVKDNLLSRMKVIEQLQASRSATVHFFDALVKTLPEGVYLKEVRQSGKQVDIHGIAQSNGRVSAYMKNLDASSWFSDPKLVVIKTSQSGGVRHADFQLRVTRLTKPAEKGKKAGGGAS